MPKNVDNLINIFTKHGGAQHKLWEHLWAKIVLIIKSKKSIDDLIEALNHEDQAVILEVAEILGCIGDKKAIPHLKHVLTRNDLWGATAINTAVALIRLGDSAGTDFLKQQIINPEIHRDTRINAARALIRLGFNKIFERNDCINFNGESMPGDWPKVLEKFVDRLREK